MESKKSQDQVRDVTRRKHYSIRTKEAYVRNPRRKRLTFTHMSWYPGSIYRDSTCEACDGCATYDGKAA